MIVIMVGMQDSLLIFESSNTGWNSRKSLTNTNPQSIAHDPLNSGRAYCATFGNGLWRTDDSGLNWSNIGNDVIAKRITFIQIVELSSKALDSSYTVD